jgi:vibriolysin
VNAMNLGTLLGRKINQAAQSQWFTTGVIVTADPLTVKIDGSAVPAVTVFGSYAPAVDDTVLVGVLRGEPSVGYAVFDKIVPPPPVIPPPPGPDVPPAGGTWFTATDTPLDLPDYPAPAVSSHVEVTGIASSGDTSLVFVAVDITHTYPADLVVTLEGAAGWSTELYDWPLHQEFEHWADPPGAGLTIRLNLPAVPVANLNGTWTLSIQDVAGVDVGTLDSWSLIFPPA